MSRSISRLLALLILILAIFALPSLAVENGKPSIAVTDPILHTTYIEPGDVFDIWFKVVNRGDGVARDVTIELRPRYPFEAIQLHAEKGKVYIGSLDQGAYQVIRFRLRVDPNAISGSYELEIVARYRDEEGEEYEDVFLAEIPIYGKAALEVESPDPLRISPGEKVNLSLRIVNEGTAEAKNIYVYLSPSPDDLIGPIGGNFRYIRSLKPGESREITFSIYASSNAPTLATQLPFKIVYEEVQEQPVGVVIEQETKSPGISVPTQVVSRQYSKKMTVDGALGIRIVGEIDVDIARVLTDPREIRAGDDYVRVDLEISNSGDEAVDKLDVYLERLPEGFELSYSGGDRVHLGRLRSGESKIATFFLNVGELVKPGRYRIPVKISFEDQEGEEHELEKSFSLEIKPRPYISIERYWTEPEVLLAGGKAKLHVILKNVGSERAEHVDIRVVRRAEQPFTFSVRSDYVGTLDPGETGEGVLEFDIDRGASLRAYSLDLLIRYSGDSEKGDTNVYTQSESIRVEVRGAVSKRISKYAAVALVILVVSAILYSLIGRSRKT